MTTSHGATAGAPWPSDRPFDVVPIVMSSYLKHPLLTGAEDDARQIAELLRTVGGVYRPWEILPDERNTLSTGNRLQEWADPAPAQFRSAVDRPRRQPR